MKPPKSIKTKILFLYFTLFVAAIFSGAYIYKEAKKFTIPEEHVVEENNKIFLVTSAINNLYSSEAYSRTAILSGNPKDIKLYYRELDTIVKQINLVQTQVQDQVIVLKLDSVIDLLSRKKISFENIIKARKDLTNEDRYTEAFSEIYNIREEIEKNIQPIVIQSKEKEKRSGWARLFKGDNTDTIKTTVNYPSISDSLISAMERILLTTQAKINDKQKNLLLQEQRLLQENKIITDQLREILQNVEQNILALSYQKINESKSRISAASTNIAYIGGTALIVVLILGWIIIRDINQTQEYRTTLEKLNKENEVLLRSKSMLLATVTHDLQTPLGGLIGFTDLLDQTPLDGKQKQYVHNIKSSSQYITNLVNDLTDFSRLENNKISIQQKSFNPKTLIENTCFLLIPNATNKNIELTWEVEDALNNSFISDPHRIKQVLTNLVTNAIKFTQDGGVMIKAFTENNFIKFQVIDSGIGIAANQTDNIFKEFQQAHDGIEKKFGGTGLGLNISKRMIELLGGEIYVESVLNEGSTFTFTIPIQEAHEEENIVIASNDLQTVFRELKSKNILVIDDDKVQLQLMEEILSPLFNKVTTIFDATTIDTVLSNDNYNIILSDIQMPKMDGFELIHHLKTTSEFKDTPVIALSGKRDITLEEFTNAGFASAHPKPLQLSELLILISKILNVEYQLITAAETPKKEQPITIKAKALYNTRSLTQFIGDDINALKNLLVIFIDSTKENLLDLHYAKEEFDIEQISNIAHKMLPMFKQLEIKTLINTLEVLEDKSISFDTQEDLNKYIDELEVNVNKVLDQIKLNHFE
ncbi:hybrid sensor histidine kinase/response regulator [Myroides marinus]|uniref:histidine kinase n=1 Tax=Myroides marinus TaxID=703342 RepID=A0A1H6XPT8_9FLAO|nr:ATP-binding protein [Myroides marinus]KUF44615.1 hybrid sensor histidine kinase/response regulator [Myroides marinus]MDM1371496.1 response regulator [Myroides marinus]MDM1379979.1 response regulator [Myroides marinus]MDM1387250.1 response regulator [Myroides marinus]MDM1394463.1 response regulator [Myroides marinus]